MVYRKSALLSYGEQTISRQGFHHIVIHDVSCRMPKKGRAKVSNSYSVLLQAPVQENQAVSFFVVVLPTTRVEYSL